MGVFLYHEACPLCGSSDAGSVYDDGSASCFACGKRYKGSADGKSKDMLEQGGRPVSGDFLSGTVAGLPKRGLREETLQKYGYKLGTHKGKPAHIESYYDDKRNVVAQHVRGPDKTFCWIGNSKKAGLFGQHLFPPGGKSIVVTEGAIDAMSVSQSFNNKYPAVSLISGAQAAHKDIEAAYEYLSTFEKVVLCFDADEPGQAALEACAGILPPGKCFVMKLPRKDANEVLINDGSEPIVRCFWNASLYRPDGIVSARDLREAVLNPVILPCIPYPWAGLNEKLQGIRTGQLVTFTSGSGLGKSTIVREIGHHLIVNHGQTVGGMFLEEPNEFTIDSLIGIHLSKNITVRPEDVSAAEKAETFDKLTEGDLLYLWDHFGSNDIDQVVSKMRFMNKVLGCKFIILDHLSILVSGDSSGDERRTIDAGMTKLRTLVSETGLGLIMVSHLKRPSGDKGHEDGAAVSLSQLRGSAAIAQLSDVVIGLEKDSEDPNGDSINLKVLKSRRGGRRGDAGTLYYDDATGRLTDSPF